MEEEENKKQEHSFRIIKENGWKPQFTDLLKNPKILKESIGSKKEGDNGQGRNSTRTTREVSQKKE